jgi:hypothetical protein
MKACPYCGTSVRVDALRCSSCREYLSCRFCGRHAFHSQRPPADRPGFGSYIIERKLASLDQVLAALDRQESLRPTLGRVAREVGKLTPQQVYTVLNDELFNKKSFGQTAVALGYLTEEDVQELITAQRGAGPRIGELLVEAGVLSPERLQRELDRYHGSLLTPSDAAPRSRREPVKVESRGGDDF